ncbi:MAG: PHP domain-containing protein [Nitrospirae bacterium]|nr:PHP domain-containing protein [Nitrospirota bacterium]
MVKAFLAVLLVSGGGVWGAGWAGAASASSVHQIALAVHVHSTLSTGSLSLEELASRAREGGLDGLVLTDNYNLHVDYGVWPLRGLLRYGVNYPSVRRSGAAAYLNEIHALQRRHPDLLVIPGVEVMPHYFWTGSLWQGNLTLHNTQKNLLLVGLDDPEQLTAVIEGDRSAWRPALFWPLLLAGPAVWLWKRERVVEVKMRFFQLSRRRRRRPEAIAVAVVGGLLLMNNLVSAHGTSTRDDPYGPDPGDAPAQRLIDAARAAGGLSFWSLPEAIDDHHYRMSDLASQDGTLGPLGLIGTLLAWYGGTVSVRTNPYPESLANTTGYTGFGAVYQDHVRATEPGAEWDRLLRVYLDGVRAEPVWGIGELAYHDEGLGRKRFTDVQTVVLAESRSVTAVVSALRRGAFYARQRQPEWGLTLDQWSVHHGGDQTIAPAEAGSGQTLSAASGLPVTVGLAVSASDGRSAPVRVRVIKNGRVWREFTAQTPFDQQWTDVAPPANGRAYYRVEVGHGDQHLLSNPIFLNAIASTG